MNQCRECGTKSVENSFDLPGMKFTYLYGQPFICEQCLWDRLTSHWRPWLGVVEERILKSGVTACPKCAKPLHAKNGEMVKTAGEAFDAQSGGSH